MRTFYFIILLGILSQIQSQEVDNSPQYLWQGDVKFIKLSIKDDDESKDFTTYFVQTQRNFNQPQNIDNSTKSARLQVRAESVYLHQPSEQTSDFKIDVLRINPFAGQLFPTIAQFNKFYNVVGNPKNPKNNPYSKQLSALIQYKNINSNSCRVLIESLLTNRNNEQTLDRFFISFTFLNIIVCFFSQSVLNEFDELLNEYHSQLLQHTTAMRVNGIPIKKHMDVKFYLIGDPKQKQFNKQNYDEYFLKFLFENA